MANKIVLKKSSVAGKVPLSTDLDVGELAVNLADAKLYSKDAGGAVIAVGGGGGSSYEVGQVQGFSSAPSTGTWLQTGKYYSKASYPDLAAAIGDVADFGDSISPATNNLTSILSATVSPYMTATNGSVWVAIGASGSIQKSTDGTTWVGVQSQSTTTFSEIRYLNGMFVVVGAVGNIVTSPDGTNWTLKIVPPGNNLVSVAYGNGMYVAVGGGIYYSTDTVNWNIASSYLANSQTTTLTRVIYANSLFVAVTSVGSIFTSPDGITWTAANYYPSGTSANNSFNDIVYENSMFVAMGPYGSVYSTDGVTWSSNSKIALGPFRAVDVVGYRTATNGTVTVVAGVSNNNTNVVIKRTLNTDGNNWQTSYINLLGTTAAVLPNEVRYLNGNFIVLTNTAGVMYTSTDGIHFAAVKTGQLQIVSSIAYGNSKYVAVGASGAIYYSTGLDSWNLASGTGANAFNRVIYANSLFVAVGASGAIYTSPDGVTWTAQSSGTAGTLTDITYGGGVYVASCSSINGTVVTSPNGSTWTTRTVASLTAFFQTVTYVNSLFVACALSGQIATSSDGTTWTKQTLPASFTMDTYQCAWNGTTFLIGCANGFYLTSTDGSTWTVNRDISASDFWQVGVVNGKIFGVGGSNSSGIFTGVSVILSGGTRAVIMSSTGVNFGVTVGASAPKPVAYNGSNQYVVLSQAAQRIGMYYSSDGLNWNINNTITLTTSAWSIAYLNGNYIVTGSSGGIVTSSNGTSWTVQTSGTANTLYNAAYGASTYVVVGATGTILYSTNLTSWSLATGTGTAQFNDVTFNATVGKFVAVGATNSIYYSTNGSTWTSVASMTGTWTKVIYANSLYVAIGSTGTIATSADGVAWTLRTSNVTSLADIVWNGSIFVAVGGAGQVTTSSDGITWTAQLPGDIGTNTVTSLAWSGTYFVAAGSAASPNQVYLSTDGTNWVKSLTDTPQAAIGYVYCSGGGKLIGLGQSSISVLDTSTSYPYFVNANTNASASYTYNGNYIAAYVNNIWVAYKNSSGALCTSSDGINWVPRTYEPTASGLSSPCWNGTTYFIGGLYGRYWTSTDGLTWTINVDKALPTFCAMRVIGTKTIGFGDYASMVLAGGARTDVMLATSWKYLGTSNTLLNPRTIAYNGSVYVACATTAGLMTSSNGTSWSGYTPPTRILPQVPAQVNSVQYVNTNFIATGNAGGVQTSADGTTWNYLPLDQASTSYAAAYGNSMYVIATSGGMFYSSSLTKFNKGNTTSYADVVYANSVFVAVGSAGAIATSSDGITWTARTSNVSGALGRVAYLNGVFIAVGASGVITSSYDGITWYAGTSSAVSTALYDVAYGGGVYVIVGASGAILTSTDARNWTPRAIGYTGAALNTVIYANSKFWIAGGTIWSSSDGVTWTNVSCMNANFGFFDIAYVNSKFISAGQGTLQYSSDGVAWTSADNVQYAAGGIYRIYKLNNIYFACSSYGVQKSTDGINWSLASRSIKNGVVIAMAYGNGKWVCVATGVSPQPQVFYSSTDGTNWTKSADLFTTTLNWSLQAPIDLVFANGNFICACPVSTAMTGDGCSIYTSPDGVTWTPRATPYNAAPVAGGTIATDGTTVVFTNNTNGAMKSTDGGVTWSVLSPTATGTICIYSNGVWMIGLFTSTDLVTFNSVVNAPLGGMYVSGDCITYFGSTGNKFITNKKSGGSMSLPVLNKALAMTNIAGKEIPIATGNIALLGTTAPTGSAQPNCIVEMPLYSYDTSTTFWVPPSSIGVGQVAYVYAGP